MCCLATHILYIYTAQFGHSHTDCEATVKFYTMPIVPQEEEQAREITVKADGKIPSVKITVLSRELIRQGGYPEWRKELDIIKNLYGIESKQLTPLVYLSLLRGPGEPRELVEHLDYDTLATDDSYSKMMALLDAAYKEPAMDLAEKHLRNYERCRRSPGESMDDYLLRLQTCVRNLKIYDAGTTFSDLAHARKILRSSGLDFNSQRQVLVHADGWKSSSIERTLKLVFAEYHKSEKRQPRPTPTVKTPPQKFWPGHAGRGGGGKPSAESGRGGKGASWKGSGWGKGVGWKPVHRTYYADEDGNEDYGEDGYPYDGPEDEYNDDDGHEHEGGDEPEDGELDHQEEYDDDSQLEDSEEQLLDAFYQGFRASSKHARGTNKGRGRGRGSKGGRSSSRPKTGKCLDCGQPGHWRGDPECPKVISGETTPFQPRAKAGAASSSSGSKQPNEANIVDVGTTGTQFTWLGDADGTDVAQFTTGVADDDECRPCWDAMVAGDVPSSPRAIEEFSDAELAQELHRREVARGDAMDDDFEHIDGVSVSDLPTEGPTPPRPTGGSSSSQAKSFIRPKPKPTPKPKPSSASSSSKKEKVQGECPNRFREPVDIPVPEVRFNLDDKDFYDPTRSLDDWTTDFIARVKYHERRLISSYEKKTLECLSKRQLERVALGIKQCYSGTKATIISRIMDFVNGESENQCELDHDCPMKWSGNKHWGYGTCTCCGRQVKMIARSEHATSKLDELNLPSDLPSTTETEHEAFVVLSSDVAIDALWQDLSCSQMISDSGCRRSVAGSEWHRNYQNFLRKHGLQGQRRSTCEEFRFGGGVKVQSNDSWVYPAGINHKNGFLDVALVDSHTPPLLSQSAMRDIGMKIDFGSQTMSIQSAGLKDCPVTRSASGHILLNVGDFGCILEYPKEFRIHEVRDYTAPSSLQQQHQQQQPQQTDKSVRTVRFKTIRDAGTNFLGNIGVLARGRRKRLQRTTRELLDAMATDADGSEMTNTPARVAAVSAPSGERAAMAKSRCDTTPAPNGMDETVRDMMNEKTTPENNDMMNEKTTPAYNDMMNEKTTPAHNDTVNEKTTPARYYDKFRQRRETRYYDKFRRRRGLWPLLGVATAMVDVFTSDAVKRRKLEPPAVLEPVEPRRRFVMKQREKSEGVSSSSGAAAAAAPISAGAVPELRNYRVNAAQTSPPHNMFGGGGEFALNKQHREFLARMCNKPGWYAFTDKTLCAAHGYTCLSYEQCSDQTLRSIFERQRVGNQDRWRIVEYDRPIMQDTTEFVPSSNRSVTIFRKAETLEIPLEAPEVPVQVAPEESQGVPEGPVHDDGGGEPEPRHDGGDDGGNEQNDGDGGNDGDDGVPMEEGADNVPDPLYPNDIPCGEIFDTPEGAGATAHVPHAVRLEVRRAHRNLGHCSRAALLRILRLGNATPEHLCYAKHWQCEICLRRTAPMKRRVVSSSQRPTSFGSMVGIDSKEITDIAGARFAMLNVVDYATKYSMLLPVENSSSREAARAFLEGWINWAGTPDTVQADQGSEFRKDFSQFCENAGISIRCTPTESPWQHGFVERHGAVSADILRATIEEMSVTGGAEMRLAVTATNICKNRRPDPSGYSPRMRVFGCGDRLPGSVLDSLLEQNHYPEVAVHDAILKDPQFQRAQAIRESASIALSKLDNSEKLRKAITHNYRPSPVWHPGECVFYWRIRSAFTARGRRDFDRWHGPGVILARELSSNGSEGEAYWVVHNGVLLLVSPQHIRSASPEERLASEAISEILSEYGSHLTRTDAGTLQHTFEDLRDTTGDERGEDGMSSEVVQPMPPRGAADAAAPDTASVGEPEAHPDAPTPMRGASVSVETEEVVPPQVLDAAEIPVPEDPDEVLADAMFTNISWDSRSPSDDVVFSRDSFDAFALELKPMQMGTKGKELDSRKFTAQEWVGFREAIQKNWNQHLEFEAVRVIQPDEARKVDPSRIFRVPARFVHTLKEGKPNSRFVIPGHLDPDMDSFRKLNKGDSAMTGGVRTDAPVAPQIGLMLVLLLSSHFHWTIASFDIGSAFLTGRPNSRRLYVRPPREGLPGVSCGCLIELLKGVFGLREAPRLWWENFSKILREAGFEALKSMKGVFVIRENGSIRAVLCVHVDDGLWAGFGEKFEKAKAYVRSKLNVKKEHKQQFEFLGRTIKQLDDFTILINQHEYINKIEPIFVTTARRRTPDAKATPEEVSKYRSLGQQLAWPARTTLPGLAYDVSDLQQRTVGLDVAQILKANTVLRTAKAMVARDVMLRLPPGSKNGNFGVLCVHDASYDRQPRGGSQQGYMTLVTDRGLSGRPAIVLDWVSSRIHRVVKSTLAAESAAAAFAYDRSCFVRVALAEMLYGWYSKPDWTGLMFTIPMLSITDCRSFVDLVRKEGSMPTERRIALDIADMREGFEGGDSCVWTDTRLMLCDPLTKHLPDQSYFEHVLKTCHYIFRVVNETKVKLCKQ